MSDKLPEETRNEEVDLGQLFSAIGRLFEKLFAFIGWILKNVFNISILALKPVVNNFKVVSIVMMTAVIIGFVADKFRKPKYVSNMLVKPYFQSKYQLANNVNYFNALIESENYSELSNIFEIDTLDAKELIGFEMKIGPETKNDLLVEYDAYISAIDSTLAEDVTFDDYTENRDILEGSIFSIKAEAHKQDIFSSLETGFIKTFENEFSKKLKKIRDESLEIQKGVYRRELKRVDSLQNIYLEVIKTESENAQRDLAPTSLLPLMQERTRTREYELFMEELKIRDKLRIIDETLIEESDYYDILSSFEDVGAEDLGILDRFMVSFPLFVAALMALIYMSLNAFNYIKEYEE